MFKKDMGASPAGRRSVQKRHECLPCGEEKCSKMTWTPPLWGGRSQKIDIISSLVGRQLPEIWTVLLPRNEPCIMDSRRDSQINIKNSQVSKYANDST